jgi:hypothetical protein
MIARCTNPHGKRFKDYGGDSIKVCDRWHFGENGTGGFECFLEDMGERPEGKTLDRWPNPYGNYESRNCRWATPKQQRANYRLCQPRKKPGHVRQISSGRYGADFTFEGRTIWLGTFDSAEEAHAACLTAQAKHNRCMLIASEAPDSAAIMLTTVAIGADLTPERAILSPL